MWAKLAFKIHNTDFIFSLNRITEKRDINFKNKNVDFCRNLEKRIKLSIIGFIFFNTGMSIDFYKIHRRIFVKYLASPR